MGACMRLQIGGKTKKASIQLIFRGVSARELGRNETYIYQFDSEVVAGKIFNFENLFSHNPKQNVSIFMKHMFRIRTEHISERVFKLLYTVPTDTCRFPPLLTWSVMALR